MIKKQLGKKTEICIAIKELTSCRLLQFFAVAGRRSTPDFSEELKELVTFNNHVRKKFNLSEESGTYFKSSYCQQSVIYERLSDRLLNGIHKNVSFLLMYLVTALGLAFLRQNT